MQVNPSIFKAYDIRGIYPNQLNEETAQAIGFCFARLNQAKKIIVGRDMRLSSKPIFDALAKGINQAGSEVIDIGLVSTDVTYFASGKLNLAAIMITASHNPKEWNGFKLTKEGAVPFGENDIKKLRQAVIKHKINIKNAKQKIKKNNILPNYNKNVLSFIDKNKIKKLKIVADAGNGMGGKILSKIYAELPCKIIPLYFKLDGSFPNHQPSPIEGKNMVQLQKKVRQTKADFGMAFDGDADRVFFVDEKSNLINGASIVAILAKYFLSRHKGEKIIYDLRCSRLIPELIKANGGQPLISRVGHSFIKKLMKQTKAVFGGELSGHYYFRDNYRADSAMITAVIITQILSESKKNFSGMIKDYIKYFQIEETNSEVKNKDAKLKEIKRKYKNGKISNLDGITVEYPEWWFNIRKSNTEPVLRLNLEAKTKELMENKKNELLKLIREN
ncbi:MAG: phosphomannomutase/phosphoglucomutase [Patescibacteria group bacterium]|nr:phosphomannomutase/phosphoglucomutase [Patescibacteria group bacterium]